MEESIVEKKLRNKHEIIVVKKHDRVKKILITLLKIVILFVMPILVAILDHFVF